MRRYSDAECRKLWDEKFTFFFVFLLYSKERALNYYL